MKKTILKVLFAILAFSLVMFVACKNEPVASGAGSITCTLNGVVYDSQANKPVEGAWVDIGTQTVKTDRNGCFALENVAPGSYTISIVKEGYEMETIDEVLVDSGRFYNNLSENDKAALTELISSGAEIDDYYVGLLFGGERDADGDNPDIDSVGDAKYYGQTVFAVGLTPSNAVLEGAIKVKFQDGLTYDVPEGVGVIAFLEGLLPGAGTYRTTVGENGSFRFENIQNGVYHLAVDPMSITLNESTVELDRYIFMEEDEDHPEAEHPYEALVINGYGTTNTLFYDIQDVEVDPFKLRILSVKAIDRSELPLSSVSRDVVLPTVSMEAGQAIVIEFNKHIDEDAFGTFFRLVSSEQVHTQLTGYTKHLIVNGGDGHGYAYVWHDSINSSSILELWYNVSSFDEDDSLGGCIDLGYHYQLNLKETNLYGYDYNHILKDGVFKADQPIEIEFDREIPKGSTVEGVLTKKYQGQGELPPDIDIPVIFEYDDNVLRAYAALEYRTDFGQNIEYDHYYTLKFKITTSEDVVVYNTERGLYKPKSGNMILSDDNNSIKFTTAEVSIIAGTGFEEPYGPIDPPIVPHIDPYDGFFAVFNLDLEGNRAVAYLTYSFDEEHSSYIPLNCEIADCIITATLDEDEALKPKFKYTLHLAVLSERYDVLFTLEKQFEVSAKYFDPQFKNGLKDFTINGDDYDWDSVEVSFSWTSLGEFLGDQEVQDVYDLYMRTVDYEGEEIEGWKRVASFPEIDYFKYTYRDKEIKVVCPALHVNDLLYGRCAQFILVTYDEDGLMIQSPVRVVDDMVGPIVDNEDPYIAPGTPYSKLHEYPIVFTLTADEPIDTIEDEDVVVGGAHPEYFDVTWVMTGNNSVDFTVKAKNTLTSLYYEEGDLKLTITLRDTSYNETEKVIDFKN